MTTAKHVADILTKRSPTVPTRLTGTRVLMDRLWSRGLRKPSATLTLWLRVIAPNTELRT
jgi:uncharacterized protein YeaO (DUF488 family)